MKNRFQIVFGSECIFVWTKQKIENFEHFIFVLGDHVSNFTGSHDPGLFKKKFSVTKNCETTFKGLVELGRMCFSAFSLDLPVHIQLLQCFQRH